MTDNLLEQGDDQVAIDPNKNYVTELVGDGKKFKTVEDLARGKFESDMYIQTLIRTQDELRSDYQKVREENMVKARLEDLIDKIQAKNAVSNDNTQNVNAEVQKLEFDPKQIESLVSNKVQEIELTRRQQENFNNVRDKLKERFGNNYQGAVKEQLESIGMSDDMLNNLARNEPKAVYRLLGLDSEQRSETFQAPPRGNQSTAFAPKTQKRTWAYYQEMRKDNKQLYNDPKTVVQMHKDHSELGTAFEDGDWNA